ncbi:MAG: DNA polymerase III subunit gamma/tau, partial [Candidatus Limnocylindrales bacterium]
MSSTAPHQALYRRWRAQTFGQIVGQVAIIESLRNSVRTGQVAHALLLVGPRGTGKTSVARIVAKALNCTNLVDGEPCDRCPACVSIREGRALDVIEMDAASNNRVDDMRELLARTMTAPSDLRRKVYIVDEVQRISQGWDVLLRTLEEPPPHVAFIFCTTDASQIRPAVLSRVQRYDFRRLTVPQIEGKLRRILEAEGRAADDEAIGLIAGLAAGGMRDAESMLDQLLSSSTDRLTADQVRDLLGLAEAEAIEAFVLALVRDDALAGMEVLDGLEERGRDLRSFVDQATEAIRGALFEVLAGRDRGNATNDLVGVGARRLAAVGRQLATIDPSRAGPGGLRFQLELALLEPAPGPAVDVGTARPAAPPEPVSAPRRGRGATAAVPAPVSAPSPVAARAPVAAETPSTAPDQAAPAPDQATAAAVQPAAARGAVAAPAPPATKPAARAATRIPPQPPTA